MRKPILLVVISVLLFCLGACKKDKTPSDPEKVVLLLPAKDEACTTGIVISASENTVHFTWNSAENTEVYELNVKNLLSGKVDIHSTSNTEFDAQLSRNTPYSWFIVSKTASSAKTAVSEIWKFYNSGLGTVSYAPYPAEIVSPIMGQNISASAGKISLDWNGSDVDNDVATYDVYLGTSSTPVSLKSNLTESVLNEVEVTSGSTYYWKIITKDLKGNTSESGVYQFKVN
jgi:hypothetical protein